MKYPYVSNTIRVESENENEVQIYNFITDYHLTLNREDYDFLMKLDGHTDPYSLSNDREYVEDFMEFLESERLIRTSRFLVALPSIYFALWSPKENGWLQKHAPFLNRCILILVPICLYLGIRHFKYGDLGSAPVYFSGFILGAICGIILHELGHAIAALAYKGTVYEMGIGIHSLMPGAYTFIDKNKSTSTLQCVQINLAGLEMNAIVTGIFLLLTRIPYCSSFFFAGAIANGYLMALNLTGNVLVDGFDAMTELLGVKIKGELSLKSRPKIHMKGIQEWAFYICMFSIFVTHFITAFMVVNVIVEELFL